MSDDRVADMEITATHAAKPFPAPSVIAKINENEVKTFEPSDNNQQERSPKGVQSTRKEVDLVLGLENKQTIDHDLKENNFNVS